MSYQNNRRGGQNRYGNNKNNRGYNNRGAKARSGGNRGGGGGRGGKENVHFSRFIKVATPSEQAAYQPQNAFGDFAIHELIKKNIIDKGLTTPSPIQDQAIPAALLGQDIIGIANTGTGKTLAFVIPLLNKLLSDKASRALIIAPTRELAQQIDAELRQISKNSGLFSALLTGGSAMRPQLNALRNHPAIVVGTPGRIKDHMERRTLDLSRFNLVVLDEFDRMLDMGFIGDMRQILAKMATPRQSLFFSATLDTRVKNLLGEFANDPVTVAVKSGDTTENVHQNVVHFHAGDDKVDMLHDVLISEDVAKVLIFDETKHGAERLGKKLLERGFAAGSIHGGKSQGNRERTLREFRSNKITILVATDVAARGIDVADITHVINYATPRTYTDYVHRIGRVGRAGRIGHALTFVESR
jgi:superfamily II DNA/RNA helicase